MSLQLRWVVRRICLSVRAASRAFKSAPYAAPVGVGGNEIAGDRLSASAAELNGEGCNGADLLRALSLVRCRSAMTLGRRSGAGSLLASLCARRADVARRIANARVMDRRITCPSVMTSSWASLVALAFAVRARSPRRRRVARFARIPWPRQRRRRQQELLRRSRTGSFVEETNWEHMRKS
jgi:hypothetical protein